MESLDLIESFNKEYGSNPNRWDWRDISYFEYLSEDFIRKFKDKVEWNYISTFQKLSEDFIREFKDKVSWWHISYYQKLSEDFIREFKDKVNWLNISYNQTLSEDFIKEFKDKINFRYLLQNKYCPLNIKFKYNMDEFQKNIENNKFTKEDSLKHSIEYSEKIEIEDNSLNEIKKLIE